MNRLIILDNLRHGWVRLLVIGAPYVVTLALMMEPLIYTGSLVTAAFLIGALPIMLALCIPPSPTPVRNSMLLESLLPIARTELINTHWMLRAILPAAWLTLFFIIGWLLGSPDRIRAAMPSYLPMHLFAACLCGTSLNFLASGTLRQASPGNPQPLAGVLGFVAMAAPVAYLGTLWTWHQVQGVAFVLVLFALMFAAIARHIACSKLLLPMSRRPSPPSSWRKHRIGRDSRSGGFIQLAQTLFTLQFAMVTAVLLLLVLVQLLVRNMVPAEGPLYPLEELVSFGLPFVLLATRFAFDAAMMVGRECRLFRILPLSSGSLAALILATTSGTLALGMLLMSPVAFFVYGIEAGGFILTLSFCLIGITSLATPFCLRFSKLYFLVPSYLLFMFILMEVGGFFYDGFKAGSLMPLALAGMIALLSLVLSWWSLKRLLTHSSEFYRPSVPRLFTLAENHS